MRSLFKFYFCFALLNFFLFSAAPEASTNSSGTSSNSIKQGAPLSEANLSAIDTIVQTEIQNLRIPGAVVLIGQNDNIIYRRAFGLRSLEPNPQPMTLDTIFDLASLSKAFVTTTAIMQLSEKHKLNLDKPVANYWPAFAAQDKSSITIRQLLTHTSGLPAGIDLTKNHDAHQVRLDLANVKPKKAAGQQVLYSDINFAVLGEIVSRTSGLSLNNYADKYIFNLLNLHNTGYTPTHNRTFTEEKLSRIAPTSAPLGFVHDPLANALEGVSGNAGVFSCADDLAIFAQTLLHGGRSLLSTKSINEMFSPQMPNNNGARGLGWRLDPIFASNRAALPNAGAASHLGYTGTGLWLDPIRNVFIIILSNRLIMPNEGDAGSLRAKIVDAVSQQLGPLPAEEISKAKPELSKIVRPYIIKPVAQPVLTGIDVLTEQHFSALKNKRIGLLTHRSAVDWFGHRTIDVLFRAPDVSLVKLFSPEHGLNSDREGKIKNDYDALTGLPIISLYGDQRHPSAEMLQGLDAIVVDLQDVGARFYTYASSVAYLLETTAPLKIPVIILDRPNPIDASHVQGPLLDQNLFSFTGYWSLPVRHGMTLGELAKLFIGELHIPAILQVIPMKNFTRSMYFDETGLPFIPPSPNLINLTSTLLYPGVGMIEGASISVGRGTTTPFEIIGAPWINNTELSTALNKLGLAGVNFKPVKFTPTTEVYAGKLCQGVRINITDYKQLDSPALGLALAETLWRIYPEKFSLKATLGSVGSRAILDKIREGLPLQEIIHYSDQSISDFSKTREKYLLYPM